jgi:hypothetical protein
MYILQHVSAVRGHQQVSHIHSFYINVTLFLLLLLYWPMFTLMEVVGVVCLLVFVFPSDELLKLLK